MWGRDPDLEDSLEGPRAHWRETASRAQESKAGSEGTGFPSEQPWNIEGSQRNETITLHNNGIALCGPWGFHQGHADVCHHEEQPCIYTSETVPGQLVSRRVCGQMAQSDFSGS